MVRRARDAGSQPVAVPEGAAILERHPDLAEIVRRIVAAYEPERVYLFGSYARGDTGPDSDYDILVVVPGSAPAERRESRLAYQALRGTGAAVDVVVVTREYFEWMLGAAASLPATVQREGRLLHAAEGPRVHLTREWLRRVEGDLGAGDLLQEDASLCEAAAFHAEQAVEKTLKAYLAWNDVPFRQTHDLVDLAEQCATIDGGLRTVVPKVELVAPYATAGQYPFSQVPISPEKAQAALRVAHEIRDIILARLPSEFQP